MSSSLLDTRTLIGHSEPSLFNACYWRLSLDVDVARVIHNHLHRIGCHCLAEWFVDCLASWGSASPHSSMDGGHAAAASVDSIGGSTESEGSRMPPLEAPNSKGLGATHVDGAGQLLEDDV